MCLCFQDELAQPLKYRPAKFNFGLNGKIDEGCPYIVFAHLPMLNLFSIRINLNESACEVDS
jgi:hypothetical protein